jgi:Lipid A 3-O-deacylase (PagL)
LQTDRNRETQCAPRPSRAGLFWLGCLLLPATLVLAMPPLAHGQQPCRVDKRERAAARRLGEKRPVESEIIFEGQGSFGNYKIFAQGEDSKLFSSGVEYDRHSWGCLLKAQVYYVAEFLPFVLLDEPAQLNYYGVPLSTNKRLVPGVGITPVGFRMLWRDGKAIKPYLMAKGGFLVFTQKAESPNASYENISLQSDIGVQIRLSPRLDLRLGMGDYHFSNAFVVPSNPGLDVMSYTSGISFHLNR